MRQTMSYTLIKPKKCNGMLNIRTVEEGTRLEVKIQPSSKKDEIVGIIDGKLKIKLKAKPVEGEANRNCIIFFANLFDVSKSDIIIERGLKSRNKLILIKNLPIDKLKNKLDNIFK